MLQRLKVAGGNILPRIKMASKNEELTNLKIVIENTDDLEDPVIAENSDDEEQAIANIIAAADGDNISDVESEKSGMELEVEMSSSKPIFQVTKSNAFYTCWALFIISLCSIIFAKCS